jgi:hypothetical protein
MENIINEAVIIFELKREVSEFEKLQNEFLKHYKRWKTDLIKDARYDAEKTYQEFVMQQIRINGAATFISPKHINMKQVTELRDQYFQIAGNNDLYEKYDYLREHFFTNPSELSKSLFV